MGEIKICVNININIETVILKKCVVEILSGALKATPIEACCV